MLPKDEENKFFRNVGKVLPDYRVSLLVTNVLILCGDGTPIECFSTAGYRAAVSQRLRTTLYWVCLLPDVSLIGLYFDVENGGWLLGDTNTFP